MTAIAATLEMFQQTAITAGTAAVPATSTIGRMMTGSCMAVDRSVLSPPVVFRNSSTDWVVGSGAVGRWDWIPALGQRRQQVRQKRQARGVSRSDRNGRPGALAALQLITIGDARLTRNGRQGR